MKEMILEYIKNEYLDEDDAEDMDLVISPATRELVRPRIAPAQKAVSAPPHARGAQW